MFREPIIRLFWPPVKNDDFADAARRRAMILYCMAGGILGVTSTIAYFDEIYPERPNAWLILLLGNMVFLSLPFVFARSENIRPPLLIYGSFTYLFFFGTPLLSGGIISVQVFFLVPWIFLMVLSLKWYEGAALTVAVLAGLTFVYKVTPSTPPSLTVELTRESLATWLFVTLSTCVVFAAMISMIYQHQASKAIAQLAQARRDADAANKAKSEFLATMSHEIRTPMNGVLGMAELLKSSELSDQQSVFADTIYRSGSSLLAIINDILDYSKIEAGKFELDVAPFDLHTCVEEVAFLIGATARDKGIELCVRISPETPSYVVGDAGRLRQALTNLVGNAVKFTETGHVLVDVSSSFANDQVALEFRVEDTGVGIPEDRLDAVFNKFTQAESSTTRRYGGTGLGLSITAGLIEAMNGEFGVESDLGVGSVFWFRISLPIEDQATKEIAPIASFERLPILIVDDLDVNRSALEQRLLAWGALPALARNAEEGLERLREAARERKPYSVVIVDYEMPAMDGVSFVTAMRKEPSIAGTQVVALSSIDQPIIMREFREVDVDAVLLKPVRATVLHDALAKTVHTTQTTSLRGVIKRAGNISPGGDAEESQLTKTAPSQILSAGSAHEKPRLLVAEDNTVNRMVVDNMIDKSRYDLVFAENGLQAVEEAASGDFSLILMDISMPEMDGMEATRVIRRHAERHGLARIPIIALTAHAMQDDRDKFIAAGMDDHVTKPMRSEHLSSVLEKWLGEENGIQSA